MIFLGDIAIPENATPNFEFLPESFHNQVVVANLEGAIITYSDSSIKEGKLYSNRNVIDYLKKWNVKAVSIANNHITDYPEAFEETKRILYENGIYVFGAGKTVDEAKRPLVLEENGEKYVLIAFGWDVISCQYPENGKLGVNPFEVEHIINCVKEAKLSHGDCKIIILPHWDYELEKYPMPAHRILARILIDIGVDAVIGHHPHCVQGIELYNGKPIVYSLGNWFIPQKVYMNGKLQFPEYAKMELAFELGKGRNLFHWFDYSINEHSLIYLNSEQFEESKRRLEYTPFEKMDNKKYYMWFKKNRVKRRLLPIYVDVRNENMDKINDVWVKERQKIIDTLADLGLKKRSGIDENK